MYISNSCDCNSIIALLPLLCCCIVKQTSESNDMQETVHGQQRRNELQNKNKAPSSGAPNTYSSNIGDKLGNMLTSDKGQFWRSSKQSQPIRSTTHPRLTRRHQPSKTLLLLSRNNPWAKRHLVVIERFHLTLFVKRPFLLIGAKL